MDKRIWEKANAFSHIYTKIVKGDTEVEQLGKLKKKDFYRIIILCGSFIMIASLEVLAKAKDLDYFTFVNESLLAQGNPGLTYEDFVTSMLASYIGKIILPVGLALTTWIAFIKIGFNRIFIFSWTLFTLAAAAFHLLSLELTSIFYYIYILLYIIMLIHLIRLPQDTTKEEG